MTYSVSEPHVPAPRALTLAAFLLVGSLGFVLGQKWPPAGAINIVPASQMQEDWHGNVRRSNWTR